MIVIKDLTKADIGRGITYRPSTGHLQFGVLSSWTSQWIFVRFKGPNGEACRPNDVSFSSAEEVLQ